MVRTLLSIVVDSSYKEEEIKNLLKDLVNIFDIEDRVYKSHPFLRPGNWVALSIDVEREEKLLIIQEVKDNYIEKLNPEEIFKIIINTISKHIEISTHAIVLIKQGTLPKTSSGKVQRSKY